MKIKKNYKLQAIQNNGKAKCFHCGHVMKNKLMYEFHYIDQDLIKQIWKECPLCHRFRNESNIKNILLGIANTLLDQQNGKIDRSFKQ